MRARSAIQRVRGLPAAADAAEARNEERMGALGFLAELNLRVPPNGRETPAAESDIRSDEPDGSGPGEDE